MPSLSFNLTWCIDIDKQARLDQIATDIVEAHICPDLAKTATHLVMGEGNPDADIMFIGEAPGASEDKLGRPFVGAAGRVLDELLAGIGLARDNVFITSILKYRPPGNRDPEPEEKAAFLPYLERQIEVIEPKLTVFLGRHSMNSFLPELKISQAHGKPVRKDGQVYLPLFHPAAALYNGSMKQTLVDDFALIPAILKKLS